LVQPGPYDFYWSKWLEYLPPPPPYDSPPDFPLHVVVHKVVKDGHTTLEFNNSMPPTLPPKPGDPMAIAASQLGVDNGHPVLEFAPPPRQPPRSSTIYVSRIVIKSEGGDQALPAAPAPYLLELDRPVYVASPLIEQGRGDISGVLYGHLGDQPAEAL